MSASAVLDKAPAATGDELAELGDTNPGDETGDEAAAELGEADPDGDETGDEAAAELGEADPDGDDTADAEGV